MKHYNTPKLKVCGLTQLDQVEQLIQLEADFLGFIFYPKSPRYVLQHLKLRDIAPIHHRGKVGVFVNEALENIVKTTKGAHLDFIQLHGDESLNFIQNLKEKLPDIPLIKALRIGAERELLISQLETFIQPHCLIDYFLFDTDAKSFGGTGRRFPWAWLNDLPLKLPYFLSGGLSIDNIHELKNIDLPPFAIDINSKFENAPGDKDIALIKSFKQTLKTITTEP